MDFGLNKITQEFFADRVDNDFYQYALIIAQDKKINYKAAVQYMEENSMNIGNNVGVEATTISRWCKNEQEQWCD